MGCLDHSGFVFDKHKLEFQALNSEIAKGIMQLIPADVKGKINFLEEPTSPMLTSRQS